MVNFGILNFGKNMSNICRLICSFSWLIVPGCRDTNEQDGNTKTNKGLQYNISCLEMKHLGLGVLGISWASQLLLLPFFVQWSAPIALSV